MTSYHLARHATGAPRLASLPLPALGPQAGVGDARPLGPAALAVSFGELAAGATSGPPDAATLRFVLAGELVVATVAGTARLVAGDVVLFDPTASPAVLEASGAAVRFVDLEVDAAWVPQGVVLPPLERAARAEPSSLRMDVEDGHAHLAAFVPVPDGSRQAVMNASFLCLPGEVASDWHTEEGISLVLVLAGGFELEVSGRGGARLLAAGDLCLVDDRSGRGHLTRTHGETWFAAITLPIDHAWQH
ncbi:hypothetical protein QI633_17640 [Nocardioides sp. QY071]|uniref:hypothetical protein n=1 Tax=Nocardioides sp. QY071 TaxID=3044187 RepID=UPI00249B82E7|nr:hypothetical protein [Nocardioides sp. QY071]WGY00356.1 hypothetical protein QI633_17640 [Nocardioides sp. QY071]